MNPRRLLRPGLLRPPSWRLDGCFVAWALLHAAVLAAGVLLLGATAHSWVVLLWSPLLEEAVFRLGVQDWLREWWSTRHRMAPVAMTAVLFGLAHAALQPGPWALATALPALAIGCVYERTRRLAPCVLVHAAFNLLWFTGVTPLSPYR